MSLYLCTNCGAPPHEVGPDNCTRCGHASVPVTANDDLSAPDFDAVCANHFHFFKGHERTCQCGKAQMVTGEEND